MSRKKIIRPSMRKGFKPTRGDFMAGGFICTMAFGALFLPAHVYTNPSQYSAPKMVFSRDRLGDDAELVYMAGGGTLFDMQAKQFLPKNAESGVDFTTTGTVPSATVSAKKSLLPKVVSKDVELLASDPRRALVMNDDGIYLVRPQSRLPGGGRVKALSGEFGKKRLITTRFQIVQGSSVN